MEDHNKHGIFSWNELMTKDVEAAKQFYTRLFGWTADDMPMGEGPPYTILKVGEDQVGGLMGTPPQAEGVPPYWGAYVSVDSADAAAAKVVELGGQILVPPTDIPGVGRFCTFQDPQGAVLSVIQAAMPE